MTRENFFEKLNTLCNKELEHKNIIIVCICGDSGTGKSTLGKYIRKKGFGNFSRYSISVVDDSVMSLDYFYIFNKRVKIKMQEKDELKPFLKLLPKRKKILFYVNTLPSVRVSYADILIRLNLDEETRLQRLTKRDKTLKDNHFISSKSTIKDLKYSHLIQINAKLVENVKI